MSGLFLIEANNEKKSSSCIINETIQSRNLRITKVMIIDGFRRRGRKKKASCSVSDNSNRIRRPEEPIWR